MSYALRNKYYFFLISISAFLILLLNPFQEVHSATWKTFSKNDNFDYSFDSESISGNTENTKISIKINVLKDAKEGDKSRFLQYTVNCNDSKLRLDEFKRYSEAELKGSETVGKGNIAFSTPQPNTMGQVFVQTACLESLTNTSNITSIKNPSIQPTFIHVSKLKSEEIRQILFNATWSKDDYESFQFQYSFIHSFYRKMRTRDATYDYLDAPHREAFMPYFKSIEKNMQDMDSFILKLANGLNVNPQVIYQAFGLEVEARGNLNENKINKIGSARLMSDSYWKRYPLSRNPHSVNEWYNSRDPKELFENFYPKYIAEFNAEIKKLLANAKIYEDSQIKLVQQRDERQQWLQSAEGKKFIADEEDKRQKAEASRKAEADKNRAQENAKKELLRQQCTKMKSWASDSNELIAKALKTSVSSISRIRFEMGSLGCLAVVDTPKGPERCRVMDILQDKKTGEYFADMGLPNGVQAVCGGLAF
jgi:hypothetical protein